MTADFFGRIVSQNFFVVDGTEVPFVTRNGKRIGKAILHNDKHSIRVEMILDDSEDAKNAKKEIEQGVATMIEFGLILGNTFK